MSVHRHLPDLAPKGVEGRSLTPNRHSACSWLLPEVDLQRLSMIATILTMINALRGPPLSGALV